MKRSIALILFFAFFPMANWAESDGPINVKDWNIAITLKDGTVKKGVVSFSEKGLGGFLEFYRSKNPLESIELYPRIYPINDGGLLTGHAVCEDEKEKIDPRTVKKVTEIPEPLKTPKDGGYSHLSKERLEEMQKPLICTEVDGECCNCTIGFFNYNPSIGKKELHRYLLESRKLNVFGIIEMDQEASEGSGKQKKREAFLLEMKSKKIVIIDFNCGD